MLIFKGLHIGLRKEKIQGTYFKICALYFELCQTYFSPCENTSGKFFGNADK